MTAQSDIETEIFTAEFFADFWPRYELKKGRADALKAFISIRKKGHKLAEIMDGLARYRVECIGRDPKYIKYAGGWLRSERFADEAPQEQVSPSPKPLPRQAQTTFNASMYTHTQAAPPGSLRTAAEILAGRK